MSAAQQIPILCLPYLLTGTVIRKRFVAPGGTQALAASHTIGVADYGGNAGDRIQVVAMGTAITEAGGIIAQDSLIETDASGRAVTLAAGIPVGRALSASSVAGQLIEVLLIQN